MEDNKVSQENTNTLREQEAKELSKRMKDNEQEIAVLKNATINPVNTPAASNGANPPGVPVTAAHAAPTGSPLKPTRSVNKDPIT